MLKVSEAVREILYSSEPALIALNEGYLNLSAYAKTIKKSVEIRTKKPVRTGSIVVALSRIAKPMGKAGHFLPKIVIEDFSVKSDLIEIAFERTREVVAGLKDLHRIRNLVSRDFFIVTQGVGEVAVIAAEDARPQILALYRDKPKLTRSGLASLSIRFNEKYITTPNFLYGFLRHFALRRINLIELVSTFTELSLILDRQDVPQAIQALDAILQGKEDKSWSEYIKFLPE